MGDVLSAPDAILRQVFCIVLYVTSAGVGRKAYIVEQYSSMGRMSVLYKRVRMMRSAPYCGCERHFIILMRLMARVLLCCMCVLKERRASR